MLLVGSIFGNPVLAADEAATETTPVKAEIKEVRVKGQRNAPATVERVNLGRIQQEMIRDNKDLVRYSTDVGLERQRPPSKKRALLCAAWKATVSVSALTA